MNNIIKFLYTILPNSLVMFIGKSKMLNGIRNKYLRPDNKSLIISEEVVWGKGKFQFCAPVKMALKAKKVGIESKLLRNSLKLIQDHKIEKPVILDIGANYGFISLAMQSNLTKDAKIVSFEPHPDIASAFQQSVTQNKMSNITIENVAIGSEDCDIQLNLYGQSSNILNTNNELIGTTTIKQINLDNYLKSKNLQPNYIKIDVDGYELNVLKGLIDTITAFKPIMVIETNDDYKVLEFLKKCGYTLLDLDLNEFEGMTENVFCV